jgi:hypothetical protein
MTEAGELPEPFSPAGCDLSDYGFMPLDVRRLRDSRIVDEISGDEFRAAVLLWCTAWHQIPAGSLPDDNSQLAKFAGYGRVIKEWNKVKEGALHGFVKCSDGRLYHSVICEKATEAWAGKNAGKVQKAADRERKRLKRLSEPKKLSSGNAAKSGGIPSENALRGEERIGEDISIPPEHVRRTRRRNSLNGHKAAFELFYRAYPKKKARGDAEKAYERALNAATEDQILVGATRYAEERKGQDPQYTKLAATWLNKKCWLDEPGQRPQSDLPIDLPWEEPVWAKGGDG